MSNTFYRTVPASIAGDEKIKALSEVVDRILISSKASTEFLLLLKNLERLPESIIDELAYQYHVDAYRDGYSKKIKCELIRRSISDHRIKGTPAAVERVVATVFISGKVDEWYNYGGKPYYFRVRLIGEALPDESVIDDLHTAINAVKNTRSWLEDMSFYRESTLKKYCGIAITQHKSVNIYAAEFKQPDISGGRYIGIGQRIHRKVEILNG